MRGWYLEITVFFAGAVVMALELCGSRLVAPFLGSSIYVWTSLIGVILASLSAGYWWGGRLADRRPEPRLLGLILLAAAGLTALIALLEYPLLTTLSNSSLDVRLAALLASALLFAAPSVLLGTVSPFAIRLRTTEVERSGSTAGGLYALSTLGSIFGTFSTGFYLFSWIGSSRLILLLSLVLCLLSLLVWFGDMLAQRLMVLALLLVLAAAQHGLYDAFGHSGLQSFDTRYHRVLILDAEEEGRKKRIMVTDPLGSQSAMFLDDPNEPAGPYYRFYDLAVLAAGTPSDVLLLGGGGYSYPKHFLDRFKESRLDVVELDPGLTELARSHFHLQDDPRMAIFHQDARTFLARSEGAYDVVLLDVFRSSPELPFYLATTEALQDMHRILRADGILCINVISGITGESGYMLQALAAGLKERFSQLYLFAVKDPNDSESPQNLILMAFKGERPPDWQALPAGDRTLLRLRREGEVPSGVPPLSDDFAPVERYMLPVLKKMSRNR